MKAKVIFEVDKDGDGIIDTSCEVQWNDCNWLDVSIIQRELLGAMTRLNTIGMEAATSGMAAIPEVTKASA